MLTGHRDIADALHSLCVVEQSHQRSYPNSDGDPRNACAQAQRIGAAVSSDEVTRLQNQSDQAYASQKQASDRADSLASAKNSSPGFMSSLAGALTSVQQASPTPTIQDAAAQQQANLAATAAAIQQQKQAEAQARAAEQNQRPVQATSVTGVRPTPTSSSTNASVASTPIVSETSPYPNGGTGSIETKCTDMTGSVRGTVKVGSDGFVIGSLTNSSSATLYVSYTFKKNGVPSNDMANAGATTIRGGQTVGGELQGLYSTTADNNAPKIYWYAVLSSDHDKYGCVHKW